MWLIKRELKGINMLKIEGCVKPTEDGKVFLVRSEHSGDIWYRVSWKDGKWACECKDFAKHGKKCKHIWCLLYWLALKRLRSNLKSELAGNVCPHCKSSEHIVKKGFRYNLSGPKPLYYCKQCKKTFTERSAFLGMKNSSTIILAALDLYFKGLSLRKVRDHIQQFYGKKVHHTTILKWVRKYSRLISEYLKGLEKDFGHRWSADETVIKISGRHLRLWGLMDTETKMLIAHRISERRTAEEARKLFEEGVLNAGKAPLEVVTDGFSGYHEALQEMSRNVKDDPEKGIVHIYGPLTGEINNNLIERFFGEIKGRISAMRGVKSKESFSDFIEGLIGLYNINKIKQESISQVIEKAYLKRLQGK